jgi:hypothetical protein
MKLIIPAVVALALAIGFMPRTAKAVAAPEATQLAEENPSQENANGGASEEAHENSPAAKDDTVTAGKNDKPKKTKKDKD